MSSKYQPQLFGWFADLDKGACYRSELDEELIYTNNTFCMIGRFRQNERLQHNILFSLVFVLCVFLIIGSFHSFIYKYFLYFNYSSYLRIGNDIFLIAILMNIISIFLCYCLILPELFRAFFSPKDSPIVFNRKTNKVYINESEFFSFKPRFHPKYLLHPRKKTIKEYDWADLHGVAISNYSKVSKNTIMLMACKPGTYEVERHIILDHGRSGLLNLSRWGWINNYLVNYDLYDEHGEGKLLNLAYYEQQTADADLTVYGWPQWMLEAFNARSLEELAQIKQQHGIKE
ncbi:hypothetical protein RHO12_11710 [Orbus sturtevantii]|uniref:DUF6708 domain-containing protein n=1 Tax=Orbus sturtevantii TaxID=3074109 RepID=UPI00370DB5D0